MDFIKKLLGGILGFVGNILGFIVGLLGFGKKSEYFMELKEEVEELQSNVTASIEGKEPAQLNSAKPEPAKPAPAKAEATKPAPAKPAPAKAEAAKPEPVKAETAKPEPVKAEPVKAETAKPAKASKSVATQSAEASPKTKPPEPAKAPEPVASSNGLSKTQTSPTFAPNYLMSSNQNGGRRRPGPSMVYFLDMAKQVKTRG